MRTHFRLTQRKRIVPDGRPQHVPEIIEAHQWKE
jgi:hypothetical protein